MEASRPSSALPFILAERPVPSRIAAAGRIAQPAGRARAHDDSSAYRVEPPREVERLGHFVGVRADRPAKADPQRRTHAERLVSRDGYFAPESVIRKVGNTPLTPFLGGGPAVLLQVAHPLVAVGVVQHSDYRRDLWRRLGRTLRALYLITYGTKAEAERAAEAVQTVHARIHGKTDVKLGRFPAGTPYSASDPALMLWVHATLVEASLCVYQRFVQTLSPEEQERYYREMALVARLFGTPASAIPRSLADFRDYFAAQVASETISVTAPAREVAAVILEAPLPAPMRLLVPAHRLATAGLLPPRLRQEYRLRWSPLHELALPLAARSLRVTTTAALIAASRLAPLPRELAA
jgi:uncharacterized protein (DUF2236 family)